MDRRFKLSFAALAAVLAIAVAVAVAAILLARQTARPVHRGTVVNFDGRVVDESGNPSAGAAVSVLVDDFETASMQFVAPLDNTHTPPKVPLVLETDADGRFEIRKRPGNRLQVLDVKKSGYTWLVDYAWVPSSKHARSDNRIYLFSAQGSYFPDASKPATFPLIRVGSEEISLPSRGGSDRWADGKPVVNEPWTPLIPSAGPNAPRTAVEIERRVTELFNGPTSRLRSGATSSPQ